MGLQATDWGHARGPGPDCRSTRAAGPSPQGVCPPAPRQRVCGWEGSSLEEWEDSFLITWGPHLARVAVLSDCPPERALPLDSGPTSSVLSFMRRWPGLDVPVVGSPRAGVPPGRLCWARGESTVFVPSGVTSERVLL